MPNSKKCCKQAIAYGMLLFGRSFLPTEISFVTENRSVADFYADTVQKVTGINSVSRSEKSGLVTVAVKRKSYCRNIYSLFNGIDGSSEEINREFISNDCCKSAFLRGVFLVCGTISDPNKQYRLEFLSQNEKLATQLHELLNEFGFNAAMLKRNDRYTVYIRGSEHIEDTLTFMHAFNASLEVMDEKIRKSIVNKVNRISNCEQANIGRSSKAGEQQIYWINLIDEHAGLESLPEELRQVAAVRLENPDEPLSKLGELLTPPMSRSGVNHRLQRIKEIAEDIESKRK